METEVETWDIALSTRAIRSAPEHRDKGHHHFVNQFHITSGMFLLNFIDI